MSETTNSRAVWAIDHRALIYRLSGVAGEGASENTQSLGAHQNLKFSYLKMWF